MAGNLLEWCQNDKGNPEIVDGYGNGESKVLRGGSFFNSQSSAAAASRNDLNPDYGSFNYGFRLVLGLSL